MKIVSKVDNWFEKYITFAGIVKDAKSVAGFNFLLLATFEMGRITSQRINIHNLPLLKSNGSCPCSLKGASVLHLSKAK